MVTRPCGASTSIFALELPLVKTQVGLVVLIRLRMAFASFVQGVDAAGYVGSATRVDHHVLIIRGFSTAIIRVVAPAVLRSILPQKSSQSGWIEMGICTLPTLSRSFSTHAIPKCPLGASKSPYQWISKMWTLKDKKLPSHRVQNIVRTVLGCRHNLPLPIKNVCCGCRLL